MYLGAQPRNEVAGPAAGMPVLTIRRRAIAAGLALLVASWLLIVLMVSGHSVAGVPMAARHAGAPMMLLPRRLRPARCETPSRS